jgi:hypothetical protein
MDIADVEMVRRIRPSAEKKAPAPANRRQEKQGWWDMIVFHWNGFWSLVCEVLVSADFVGPAHC